MAKFYFEEADKPVYTNSEDWLSKANPQMKPVIEGAGELSEGYAGESPITTYYTRPMGNMLSYGRDNLRENMAMGADYFGARLAGADSQTAAELAGERAGSIGTGNYDFSSYSEARNADEDPSKDYYRFTDTMVYNDGMNPSEADASSPLGLLGLGIARTVNQLGGNSNPTYQEDLDTYRKGLAVAQGATGYLVDTLPEQIQMLLGELGVRGALAAAGVGGTVKGVKGKKPKAVVAVSEETKPDYSSFTTHPKDVRALTSTEEWNAYNRIRSENPVEAEQYFRGLMSKRSPRDQIAAAKRIIGGKLRNTFKQNTYIPGAGPENPAINLVDDDALTTFDVELMKGLEGHLNPKVTSQRVTFGFNPSGAEVKVKDDYKLFEDVYKNAVKAAVRDYIERNPGERLITKKNAIEDAIKALSAAKGDEEILAAKDAIKAARAAMAREKSALLGLQVDKVLKRGIPRMEEVFFPEIPKEYLSSTGIDALLEAMGAKRAPLTNEAALTEAMGETSAVQAEREAIDSFLNNAEKVAKARKGAPLSGEKLKAVEQSAARSEDLLKQSAKILKESNKK